VMVLMTMIRNFRSDLFHSLNIFPLGFWVVFWSKLLFRTSAVTFYGTDANTSKGRPLTRTLKKWAIEHATHTITISNFTREETKKVLKTRRDMRVIYPLLPLKTLEIQKESLTKTETKPALDSRIRESDFIVLSISRMVERKGLELLIKAISMIPDQEIKAVLVGGGSERDKLERMVRDLGLVDRVIFTGRVPDLEPYYRRAQVVTLLSYYIREEGDFEGLGFVLLEAQYFGVPVIGSQSGGIPETFAHNRTGILVPERSAERVRDAILKLRRDEKWRQTLGKEAKQFVFERFDPEKNIEQYIAIL